MQTMVRLVDQEGTARDRKFANWQDMAWDAAKRADQVDSAKDALKTLRLQIVQLEREIAIETKNIDELMKAIVDMRMTGERADLTRARNTLSITHQ